ncbi:DEAD/DEAH box helicase [Enterococcus raffinosus]|nr:DEAD/DEAH box helicase [Enterococcus raffinosus]
MIAGIFMEKFLLRTNGNSVEIIGDLSALNKRNKYHLSRKFNASFLEDRIIIDSLDKKDGLFSLLSFFENNNFHMDLDSEISTKISDAYNETERFKDFSEQAKKIWNGNCETDQFKQFCSVLSDNMSRTLYPLQLLAAYHLAFSQNACNFSVPGAGKTSIVYGAYAYLKAQNNHKKVNKLLIVGPLSSFSPWEKEYQKCFGEAAYNKRISGSLSKEEKAGYFLRRDTAEITLISYQGLIGLIDEIKYFLQNNNVLMVLDEAHKIKNTSGGAIADASLKLAEYANSRVVLTGTPAPNGYRDLYNLFEFVWPNKKIINYSPNQLDDMTITPNDARVEDLLNSLSPYFVRIKKSDLGLPPKTENPPIRIKMDSIQNRIYELIEKKVVSSLKREDYIIDNFKQAKMIRLIQAASNPKLLLTPIAELTSDQDVLSDLDEEFIELIRSCSDSNYFPNSFSVVLNIIKEKISAGERIIIWAIYVETIRMFSEFLDEKNISNRVLYGETPIETEITTDDEITREKIIDEFNSENSSFNVVIANPFAVAESISLHEKCHNAIYLERNFDGARFLQSKDRIHRYGLSKDTDTNYYYLIVENTISEVIHQRLLEKERVLIRITESRDIPLFNLLEDEINESDIKAVVKFYEERKYK